MEVSSCSCNEIAEVMSFVDRYWKSGHIMSTDRELVDFMHKNPNGDYNFALVREQKALVGILGFMPMSKYDSSLAENQDICLAMWKTIGDIGSGLSLLQRVIEARHTVGVPGINDKVAKIYRWVGFEVADFRHYYISNHAVRNFRIARMSVSDCECAEQKAKGGRMRLLSEAELERMELRSLWRPFKSATYLVNRYLKHPIYRYRAWGVFREMDSRPVAVMVSRRVEVSGSACERIVDIVGDVARCGSLYGEWQRVLQQEQSEYVDCLVMGLSNAEMAALGFSSVSGDVVIPNYFEPFLHENVVVKTAFLNRTDSRYVLFKGDGDQDRPSRRMP